MRRILLVAAALGALVWVGWIVAHRARSSRSSPAPDSTSGVRAMRLFFGAPDGDSLVTESREAIEPLGLHARVAALVAELDRGPRGRGVAVLPAGTSVLRVYLDDHGLMTLDLSGAFRQRFRGGSSAEYLAVASLVRTIGSNVPEAKRLLLVVAGKPIATLGGHLPLDRPLDVSDWP